MQWFTEACKVISALIQEEREEFKLAKSNPTGPRISQRSDKGAERM